MFEKLTTFSDSFVEVGAIIQKAHDTFENAQKQLVTGRGSAIKLAQKMVELGVGPSPGKVLAPELVALAESDGEADEPESGGEEPVLVLPALNPLVRPPVTVE